MEEHKALFGNKQTKKAESLNFWRLFLNSVRVVERKILLFKASKRIGRLRPYELVTAQFPILYSFLSFPIKATLFSRTFLGQ